MPTYKEITSINDPDFEEAMTVYNEGFSDLPDIYIDPIVFKWIVENKRRDMVMHFAVLKTDKVIGMVNFVTMKYGGIGGYMAVRKEERNRGYASFFLNKMRNTVLEDSNSKGWSVKYLYGEFSENRIELWNKKGFVILPIRYYQPPLLGKGSWIPMFLGVMALYPDLKITGEEILRLVKDLYSKIYGTENFENTEYFKNIKEDTEFLNLSL